jgi:hypothetical protein
MSPSPPRAGGGGSPTPGATALTRPRDPPFRAESAIFLSRASARDTEAATIVVNYNVEVDVDLAQLTEHPAELWPIQELGAGGSGCLIVALVVQW